MCLTQVLYKNSFIRNGNFRTCINCFHFIENKSESESDVNANVNTNVNPIIKSIYYYNPSNIIFGKCKLFGEMNKLTGKMENEYAVICRSYDTKCGIKGKYFEDKYGD